MVPAWSRKTITVGLSLLSTDEDDDVIVAEPDPLLIRLLPEVIGKVEVSSFVEAPLSCIEAERLSAASSGCQCLHT